MAYMEFGTIGIQMTSDLMPAIHLLELGTMLLRHMMQQQA
jgi:hypothetical protein